MITSASLYLIFRTLTGALQWLPNVTASNPFVAGVVKSSQYMSSMSQIFPVNSLTVFLAFLVAFEVGYLTFKVVYWFIRRIPTQS
jgi:hypothetical protein